VPAHLVAYVGVLALLAMAGIDLLDHLPATEAIGPAATAGCGVAGARLADACVSHFDLYEKTAT
jgi:hypothetical protein